MNDFTPRANQVLKLARKEAERFNHNYVGAEHLLLGLIKLGQGVAVNVLQKMGLDLETIHMEVEKHVGSGSETKVVGNIPYTPRVKKVLARAGKEAKSLDHSYVGTEHILLGLLIEGESVAARVLKGLEVDIERTRNEILKELDLNGWLAKRGITDDSRTKSLAAYTAALDTRIDLLPAYADARSAHDDQGNLILIAYDKFAEAARITRANAATLAAFAAFRAGLGSGDRASANATHVNAALDADDTAIAVARACDAYAYMCSALAAALARVQSTRANEIAVRGDHTVSGTTPDKTYSAFDRLAEARQEYNAACAACDIAFDNWNDAFDAAVRTAARLDRSEV